MKKRAFSLVGAIEFAVGLAMVIGPGHAMGQRPLETDVSGWQSNTINWTTVKNGGVKFAWTKATEGNYYVNPWFAYQVAGATAAGIPIGAYHFARPSTDPNITGANSADTEAAYFWSTASSYVKNGGAYLVPMLDWEDPLATNQFTAATLSAWVNEWCNSVSNYARASGVILRPVVYTGTWYSEPGSTYPGLTTAVTNWPNWMSDYPANPNVQGGSPTTYPWPSWNIWQYADTNWSGGDSDVFNGTTSGFEQIFVIGGTNAPSLTANPTNISVALGSSVKFSVKATGEAPLSFYWQFNGTNISGATSSNYTISAVQLTNAGGYTAVVSNSYAAVTSSKAFLSVLSQLTNANGCVLAPAGMTNWWPAEGNANDIYGTYNGTPSNGVRYVSGKQELAFHLDGSSGYVYTGAPTLPPPWTACFWVNRTNAPGTGAALLSDGNVELKLEQYDGTRQVGISIFTAGDYLFNPGYTAPQNTWTHLTFVASATSVSLYANGVFVGSTNVVMPLPRAYIGCGYYSTNATPFIVDYAEGAVDEIMLFKTALNASQISTIYTAGSAGLYRSPVFAGVTDTNGQPHLSVKGQTGKNFTIYSSSNLVIWATLGTASGSTGTNTYTDSTASSAQRFYRASQPP